MFIEGHKSGGYIKYTPDTAFLSCIVFFFGEVPRVGKVEADSNDITSIISLLEDSIYLFGICLWELHENVHLHFYYTKIKSHLYVLCKDGKYILWHVVGYEIKYLFSVIKFDL